MTGTPKSGKHTLANALARELQLPVVDGRGILDAAAAAAEARVKEATDAEARRRDMAVEAGEEYDEEAAAAELAAAAEPQNTGDFTGRFAPLLHRLDQDDCSAGFVLINPPVEPDQHEALAKELRQHGLAPRAELCLVAPAGVAMMRAASEAEYTEAASQFKRITNLREQLPGHAPEWVPAHAQLVLDASLPAAAVLATAMDVLHRRRVLVDVQAQADEQAALGALDGDDAVAGAAAGDSATPNAFSITLFCVDEAFECRSQDFLHHAFATFPDREYCVLTLPHTCAETPLLSKFTRAAAATDSTFEHVLYVANRASLLAPGELVVRRALPTDRTPLLDLVSELPAGPSVLAAAAGAEEQLDIPLDDAPGTAAFVATLAGQVVGVAVLSGEDASPGHLAAVREAFELDMYLSTPLLMGGRKSKFGAAASAPPDKPASAFLTHFAMNPIFAPFGRDLLRHALRLYGRRNTVLYRQLADDTDAGIVPTVLDDMIQVAPRRLAQLRPGERPVVFAEDGSPVHLSEAQMEQLALARAGMGHSAGALADPCCDPRMLDHALYFLTTKLFSETKLMVNTRVVVVGAGDTGLAFLRTLMGVPYLDFMHVTLVTSSGMPPCDDITDEDVLDAPVAAGAAAGAGAGAAAGAAPARATPFRPQSAFRAFDLARLCLHSNIRVVHRTVVAVDRDASTIGLDDGSVVPYDKLVLAAGLTDGTLHKLGVAPFPAAFTVGHAGTLDELDGAARRLAIGGGVGAAVDGGRRDVLVYGASIDALTAVEALMSRGIAGGRILYAHPGPAGSLPGLPDLAVAHQRVLAALEAAGVEVRASTTLVGVEETASGDAVVQLQDARGGADTAEFSMLVCAHTRTLDASLFAAVNDAGLPVDGRVVVDHRFKTTDDNIYAAGGVAKFSRRYKAPKLLQEHDAVEQGTLLAGTVLETLDPLRASGMADAAAATGAAPDALGGSGAPATDTWPVRRGPSLLPKLVQPKQVVAWLPGGLRFVHYHKDADMGKAGSVELLTQAPPPPDGQVFTHDERCCRLLLDRYGYLVDLLYLGPQAVETQNMAAFMGRHASQLNSVVQDFASGRVKDLVAFLRGDWATAVVNDRFGDMLDSTKATLEDDEHVAAIREKIADMVAKEAGDAALTRKRLEFVGRAGAALAPSTRRAVEKHVLAFLRASSSLPMFFVPGTN